MRIGVIDLGSYSVRLSVADVEGEKIKIVREKGYLTSLIEGLEGNGILRSDRVKETLEVLEKFRDEAEGLGCERVEVIGTEALRRAKNSSDFIEEVKRRTGLEVKVITPEKEGRLAFIAVAYSLKPKGKFLVVDQGGGSTEFVFGEGIKAERVVSVPMGIVSLTERFIKKDPPTDEELRRLREFVKGEVERIVEDVDAIVGLGGTITTVCALEMGILPYDPDYVHGREISLSAIEKWLGILAKIPYRERSKRFKQVEARRAKVIVSGIAMYAEILKVIGKDRLTVSDWGLKHGVLVSYALGIPL